MDEMGDDLNRDFAAIVVVLSPQGVPMVRDTSGKFRLPYLKFPGGRRKGMETPEECGVRELEEETGVKVLKESLILLKKEDRVDHMFYIFAVRLESLPKRKHVGNEGEDVGVFSLIGLKERGDVFPKHWKIPEVQTFLYGSQVAPVCST